MMMFTFSVFDRKYFSWANLVQKFKIVCSKFEYAKFNGGVYFTYFRLKAATLFSKFGPKIAVAS